MTPTNSRILSPDISHSLLTKSSQKNAFVARSCGNHIFSRLPSINQDLPEADVVLKLGFVGVGRARTGAFGLRHIWEKHGAELGVTSACDVLAFIDSVINPNANIILDHQKDPSKPLIVESSSGLVAVQYSVSLGVYQIITGYGKKWHKGVLVGKPMI